MFENILDVINIPVLNNLRENLKKEFELLIQ